MLKSIIPISLKSRVQDILDTMAGKPAKGYHREFSQRIKNRHNAFWNTPTAEIVRNTIMNASDPITKWKEGEYWQRKLSNKYNSREFAKMYGCRVAELYWKGRDYHTIDFDKLPANYVIRPTIGHSSGLVFLMDNGVNIMDKQPYTKQDITQILAKSLNENPKLEFLIEEFLRTEKGEYKIPNDFKFFMFNGEVAAIQVINRLSPSKGYTSYYDENWNQIENLSIYYPQGSYQEPPKCLSEMIAHAKQLSKAYEIFARIDFYATDKGAVFGEFTPTPAKGNFFTSVASKNFIKYWDHFCNGMI